MGVQKIGYVKALNKKALFLLNEIGPFSFPFVAFSLPIKD
jgi:hypothetical protein